MNKIEALELELAARKLVDGTELDWWKAIRLRGICPFIAEPSFSHHAHKLEYEFAIGILEGKPVWEGDIYYDGNSGYKTVASEVHSKNYWAKCSWNPPKPATVMVELPIDFVRMCAEDCCMFTVLRDSSKKALEQLK